MQTASGDSPYPGNSYYSTDHPDGGVSSGLLNKGFAKRELMLNDAEWQMVSKESLEVYCSALSAQHKEFRSVMAKLALVDAASALREQISRRNAAIQSRWARLGQPNAQGHASQKSLQQEEGNQATASRDGR